jgi:threonine dehydratase
MPGTTAPIDTSMTNGKVTNGVNGHGHVPRTPSLSVVSLPEYSPNSSPPSEDDYQARSRMIVPDEYLLPNGHPDVCFITSIQVLRN